MNHSTQKLKLLGEGIINGFIRAGQNTNCTLHSITVSPLRWSEHQPHPKSRLLELESSTLYKASFVRRPSQCGTRNSTLPVVASSVVDSYTCPCLCVDALPTTSLTLKSGGCGDVLWKNFSGTKHLVRRVGLGLSSSFVDSGREWRLCVNRSFQKHRRDRRVAIVNELGGQYEDTFDDVKTFCCSKQARRWETLYPILREGATRAAERVMVTRLHLYGKWVKKCNHAEINQEISDENLDLMRERLMETVIWPQMI